MHNLCFPDYLHHHLDPDPRGPSVPECGPRTLEYCGALIWYGRLRNASHPRQEGREGQLE